MEENVINFFSEDVKFSLENEDQYREWIIEILHTESKELDFLNFIFCSNEYLLEINRQYLSHDYYTDIITFNQSEGVDKLAGDIFISFDYAMEFSKEHNINIIDEIRRLISHGVLHLIGYNDLEVSEKAQMTTMEDKCLSLWLNKN